jgi:hypothetical protein
MPDTSPQSAGATHHDHFLLMKSGATLSARCLFAKSMRPRDSDLPVPPHQRGLRRGSVSRA